MGDNQKSRPTTIRIPDRKECLTPDTVWSFIGYATATHKRSQCSGTAARNQKPLCLINVLNRQILPALKRCEVCGKAETEHSDSAHDFKTDETFPKWRGWHAARRGLRSNLYALGVPEKVIQQIVRHAKVRTTATYYIKTVPAQVTDTMEKLEQALPQSLSSNEVATHGINAKASPAVN